MLSKIKPKIFDPKFEVVSCFCESQGEILLLQRQECKPQKNTWGVPAGKKDAQDISIKSAIEREIWEETGINVENNQLDYFGKFYVRYADFDFIYHIFHTIFRQKPVVQIRELEHRQYQWTSPKNALKMDLIQDLDACIKLFYKIP